MIPKSIIDEVDSPRCHPLLKLLVVDSIFLGGGVVATGSFPMLQWMVQGPGTSAKHWVIESWQEAKVTG